MSLYDGITVKEAFAIQQSLRDSLDLRASLKPVHTIGGADISFNKFSTTVYAGIMVLHYPSLEPAYCTLVKAETSFPYIPGYLAFREVPALMQAWELLPVKPDVLVVDGHGIAHPRRMGIAAHFGALIQHPVMGCAKKLLFGKYEEPGLFKGNNTPLMDKEEQIGFVLRTKDKVAPVFVSPGNKLGMEESLHLLFSCVRKHRLPEPTRLAHEMVNKFRTGVMQAGYHRFGKPPEQLF